MFKQSLTGMSKRKLQIWLVIFFLALSIPSLLLINQAYSELKWEAFHQHRLQAEALARRIDERLLELINKEEARPFSDYSFLNIAGESRANFLQRSPLSQFPSAQNLPGTLGYFQVDDKGVFTTPLLPALSPASSYGISASEKRQRQALQNRLLEILDENKLSSKRLPMPGRAKAENLTGGKDRKLIARLNELPADKLPEFELDDSKQDMAIGASVASAPAAVTSGTSMEAAAPSIISQQAFDALELKQLAKPSKLKRKQAERRRTDNYGLDERLARQVDKDSHGLLAKKPAAAGKVKISAHKKQARKEISRLPEQRAGGRSKTLNDSVAQPKDKAVRIQTFESEIDPFQLSLLQSGHYVLFRKVWRDGKRYTQGLLIDRDRLINEVVESAFKNTALYNMSDLLVSWDGDVISRYQGQQHRYQSRSIDHKQLQSSLLYRTPLSYPLDDMELIFSINRLPLGAGATAINGIAAILFLVMLAGFYLMYRAGAKQIELTNQQQDFVSAVSHELKTPLTSIRMYGEILREGWADEEKKKTYYDYIFDESERLSRLINNVLQLARLSRNKITTDLKDVKIRELFDTMHSRISTPIERAGFTLEISCDNKARSSAISVDSDHFLQIMINLVDNALKFSSRAENKAIQITCSLYRKSQVQITVRDFGSGIPQNQLKKIFGLFYRAENELTRETVGTGIGLALVSQLVREMGGNIGVSNAGPGAQFILRFPLSGQSPS